MNPSTTALTLNLQLPNISTVSWAVQGDQLSRVITATLLDGSTAWNPQAAYHGVMRYHKPDGTSGVYDVDEDGNPAVTWSGNVATIKIVQQALTVPGSVLMQLEFYDANNARVSAFGWINNVQPSAVTDNEFLSADYYNILTLQISAVLGAESHPPFIDNITHDWMIWDTTVNDYVDSGVYSIGPPPTLQNTAYQYANSASGTTPPSSWSGTRPAPVQGQYSWTKATVTWETGTTVYYTVAYQGVDGTGADYVKSMIAGEEATSTSTHAYAVGDRFILANVLYIATAPIAIGNTITPGTNCQTDIIGDDLSSIQANLNHAIMDNAASQEINGGASSVYLDIKDNSTNKARIQANAEGGNLRLEKGLAHAELDTYGMNSSGTGYVRFYVNDGTATEVTKQFLFKQDGDFLNGNGVSLDTLNTNAIKTNVASQTIDAGANAADLTVKGNTNSEAKLIADSEGGNIRLIKGNAYAELDTNPMNSGGTGSTRIIVNNGQSGGTIKTFSFKQDGGFVDGNSVSTTTLNSNVSTLQSDMTTAQGNITTLQSNIIYKRAISGTATGDTTYPDCIQKILTADAPQSQNVGIYTGSFSSSNSGMGSWTGLYMLNVTAKNTNYSTQGFVIAQGRFFVAWYQAAVWAVTQIGS